MPRADGPFGVLESMNDYAYKINLPGDYGVSATFNLVDLSPYLEDGHLVNLRANTFEQGEDDEDQALVQYSTLQNDPGNASFSTKTQALVQVLLLPSYTLPGYGPSQRPGFVHLIS